MRTRQRVATPKLGRPCRLDRDTLLDAAEFCFARDGFAGASTRAIAKKAGCNVAMISYYFGSKEGLYAEMLRRHFDRFDIPGKFEGERELQSAWPGVEPELRSLCAALYRSAQTALAHPEMGKIIHREINTGDGGVLPEILKNQRGAHGVIEREVAKLRKLGRVKKSTDTPSAIIQLFGPIVYTILSQRILKTIYGFKIDDAFLKRLCQELATKFAA